MMQLTRDERKIIRKSALRVMDILKDYSSPKGMKDAVNTINVSRRKKGNSEKCETSILAPTICNFMEQLDLIETHLRFKTYKTVLEVLDDKTFMLVIENIEIYYPKSMKTPDSLAFRLVFRLKLLMYINSTLN